MRLLSISTERELSLAEFPEDDVDIKLPPYAVLSHTWGADATEVTHRDIIDHTGTDKPGYEKIQFCGQQAAKDGLSYFWVDTCCIDKSDSSEVMTAINSMFRWYRASQKCYVYLSDVPESGPGCKAAFDESKWFTRGWTLQELIAPSTVEFFSQNGALLGDKKSLEPQVHRITSIPIAALRGYELSTFPSNEIFQWTLGRSTKREEDRAYCLFGIFGVVLPTAYGEGEARALRRLQQQTAEDAAYIDRDLLLLRSAKNNKLQAVEALIAAGVKTDATDSRGATALIHASHMGNLPMVKALCEGDMFNLNYQDVDGYTALMRAVDAGHLGVVLELLKYRPQMNLKDRVRQQGVLFHALSKAVGDSDTGPDVDPCWDIATALLEAGAHVAIESSDSQSLPLLHQFCKMGKPSAVKWMLKSRTHFDPNTRALGPRGSTPLMECTVSQNTDGAALAMQLLLDAGADPALSWKQPKGLTGSSALIEACENGSLSQAAILINAGANINYQTSSGQSPLHRAAILTRFQILQLLLNNGAYLTTRDESDHTPLHRACMPWIGREEKAPEDVRLKGAPECVKLLIGRGARTEVHHWADWTPLMEACSRGHVDVMRVLLQAGADPNRRNPMKLRWEGWTPLMYAATAVRNRKEACKMLIEEGYVDFTTKNARGQTAMQEAKDEETRRYLETISAQVEEKRAFPSKLV